MKRIRIALLVALSLLGAISPLVPMETAEATEHYERQHKHPEPTGLIVEIRNADHGELALSNYWHSWVGLGGSGSRAQWEVVPVDGNVVAIRNVGTGRYLRSAGDYWVGTGRAGHGLNSRYLWDAAQNDDGSYLLRNESTGTYLDGDRSNYGKRDRYSVDLNRRLAKGTSWIAVTVGNPTPTPGPTATSTPAPPLPTATAVVPPTVIPPTPMPTSTSIPPTATPVIPPTPMPTSTTIPATVTPVIPPTPTTVIIGGPTATPTTDVAPTATPTTDVAPTATPTTDVAPTATPTTDAVPTATPTQGAVPTPTTVIIGFPTPTATEVPAATPTATEVPTPTPTATEVPTPTPTATEVPPPTPTATTVVVPTATPTAVVLPTATPTPTDPGIDIRVVTGTVVDALAAANGLIQPVVGATIRVDGIEATTNASGDFTLLGVPVGVRNFEIDGSTATAGATGQPYTDYRNAVVISSAPGVIVDLGTFNATPRTSFTVQVVPSQITNVTSPDVDALLAGSRTNLEVAAGSAFDIATGQLFTGALSITQVPNCCTPSSMPQFVIDANPLIVTVQPLGVSFNPPAPLDLPNLNGYAVGAILDLWSLNPDTGTFEIKGQGQVSADGTTIETISGGLEMTDWHFFVPPPVVSGQPRWNFNISTFQRVPFNEPVSVEVRSGFSDPNGDVLTFSIDNDGGWGGSIDPLNGVISGPALADDEQVSVVVRASDGALSVTRSITIVGTSEPIYIGPRRFQAPSPGQVLTIDFSELFLNPGQQELSYELENGIEARPEPSASVDAVTGIFTIDTSQLQFYDFSINATNEFGTDSPYLVLDLFVALD